MKVRYICDSCRSVIVEFEQPSFAPVPLADQPDMAVSAHLSSVADIEEIVLYSLCEECATVLGRAVEQLAPLSSFIDA